MPPGGDGYYYFSTFLAGDNSEESKFDLEIERFELCTVRLDEGPTSADYPQSSCSGNAYLEEGIFFNTKIIQV